MDQRPYFVLGDVISNLSIAAITALASHLLFSPAWSMMAAMLMGMLLGMLIANLCCLLCLMRFFGAMEIMLPGMLTGMLVGMFVAMSRTMTSLDLVDHLLLAQVLALLCTASTWALNQRLNGEQLPAVVEDDRHG